MDGFQDGGYIWAQGVLQYHLIEVPWIKATNENFSRFIDIHISLCTKRINISTWEGSTFLTTFIRQPTTLTDSFKKLKFHTVMFVDPGKGSRNKSYVLVARSLRPLPLLVAGPLKINFFCGFPKLQEEFYAIIFPFYGKATYPLLLHCCIVLCGPLNL